MKLFWYRHVTFNPSQRKVYLKYLFLVWSVLLFEVLLVSLTAHCNLLSVTGKGRLSVLRATIPPISNCRNEQIFDVPYSHTGDCALKNQLRLRSYIFNFSQNIASNTLRCVIFTFSYYKIQLDTLDTYVWYIHINAKHSIYNNNIIETVLTTTFVGLSKHIISIFTLIP